MNKEFVKYKQALALKELGFDEPCFVYFKSYTNFNLAYANTGITTNTQLSKGDSSNITAPIKQQVFRWFREKYGLIGEVFAQKRPSDNFMYAFKMAGSDIIYDGFKTYEEAEAACIDRLIEIVKNK